MLSTRKRWLSRQPFWLFIYAKILDSWKESRYSSINLIFCTDSLGTVNHAYQDNGNLPISKFPDASQGPTLKAELAKEVSVCFSTHTYV